MCLASLPSQKAVVSEVGHARVKLVERVDPGVDVGQETRPVIRKGAYARGISSARSSSGHRGPS